MNFEQDLREQLKALPVAEPSDRQLDAMHRRLDSLRPQRNLRRHLRTLSWLGTAAALVLAAAGMYAGYEHKIEFNRHGLTASNTTIQPQDVQISLAPDYPDATLDPSQDNMLPKDTSQGFLINIEKWPVNSGNHVVLVLATNNAGDHVSMSNVTGVDTTRPQLTPQLLTWENAVESALTKHHLSKIDAQSLQIIEPTKQSKNQQLYVTGDANHSVPAPDWRLAVLDVSGPAPTPQTSPTAQYRVNWVKVISPRISTTPVDAVQFMLGQHANQVTTLWQTTVPSAMGYQAFGLYQYAKNGQLYVASANSVRESRGNWTIPGGNAAVWSTPKSHLDGVNIVTSWDSSISQTENDDINEGIVSDKNAVKVRLTFADGTVKTVSVKSEAFGVVRTYSGAGKQLNIISAKAFNRRGQVIASMFIHTGK